MHPLDLRIEQRRVESYKEFYTSSAAKKLAQRDPVKCHRIAHKYVNHKTSGYYFQRK